MGREKLSNLKEEIERLEKRKVLLIHAVGKENFDSIVDVLNQQIKKHNLDTTPNILRDLFDYVVKVECINKNIYEKTAPESLVQEQSKFIPEDSNGRYPNSKCCERTI